MDSLDTRSISLFDDMALTLIQYLRTFEEFKFLILEVNFSVKDYGLGSLSGTILRKFLMDRTNVYLTEKIMSRSLPKKKRVKYTLPPKPIACFAHCPLRFKIEQIALQAS